MCGEREENKILLATDTHGQKLDIRIKRKDIGVEKTQCGQTVRSDLTFCYFAWRSPSSGWRFLRRLEEKYGIEVADSAHLIYKVQYIPKVKWR